MANSFILPPSIGRVATVAAAAIITLGVGIALQIKCGSNDNSVCQRWTTQDGRSKAVMTSSGNLTIQGTFSGAVLFGYGGRFSVNEVVDQVKMRGTISGTSLRSDNLTPQLDGTILCKKANGAIGYCSVSVIGVVCTCN